MAKTLVIMAAGLASRYGGAKQIEKVGPSGEILMEYTIYDARKAGFDHFVIILQPGMKDDFRQVCGGRLEKHVSVDYAFQSTDKLPTFFRAPADRVKPYGTVPAVLCAEEYIKEPFAVVNADDYYGPGAFATMSRALEQLPAEGAANMVAYRLKNTVSSFGAVTRGVCQAAEGKLTGIEETRKICRFPDGSIRTVFENPEGDILDGESVVSMNFWGFSPRMLGEMEAYQEAFLRALPEGDMKSECLLPIMVGDMLGDRRLEVEVLTTDESWFGMTYREDRATTAEMLRTLTDQGQYPEKLFP